VRKSYAKKRVPRLEKYTAKRRAEFLLSNAITSKEYAEVRKEVRQLGLNPGSIPHAEPSK
jgi:hypothetical protein